MGRPNRIALVILVAALAVFLAAPQPATAFSGLEIASIVIAGISAIPLVVTAAVKFFKTDKTDEKAKDKPADETAAKPPITVLPEQIFTE